MPSPPLYKVQDHPLPDIDEDEGEGGFIIPGGLMVDTGHILRAFREMMRDERQAKLPTTQGSDDAWDMYHARMNFDDKEWWQSQLVDPKVFNTVERVTSVLVRILEKSVDWVEVLALRKSKQVFYDLVKQLALYELNHDDVEFNRIFRLGIKSSLLSHEMTILVLHFGKDEAPIDASRVAASLDFAGTNTDQSSGFSLTGMYSQMSSQNNAQARKPVLPDKNRSRLQLELVNPDYVIKDQHTGGKRFKVYEQVLTKGQFRKMASSGGWNLDAVERAITRGPANTVGDENVTGSAFISSRESWKKDTIPANKDFKYVIVSHFFGTLEDPDSGEILVDDSYFCIANYNELMNAPVTIGSLFWEGEDPIISAPIIEVPFAPYGRSPIVMNLDMFQAHNDFMNLMIDFFQAALMGIKEIDRGLLDETEEDPRGTGIYPGKMLYVDKSMSQGQGNAITNVPFTDLQPGFWQFFQYFQQELSSNSLLSDTLGGMPRSRGRISAFEFNRRATESGGMIELIFSGLEDNVLAKLIRKVFFRVLQFTPQDAWSEWIEDNKEKISPKDPALKAEWDKIFDDLKTWDPRKRFEELAGYFQFRCKIFTALGDRQQDIEKGTFLLQTLGQIPGGLQYVNVLNLLRYIVRAFGWDPMEVLNTDALGKPPGSPDGPPIPGEAPQPPNVMEGLDGGSSDRDDFTGQAFPGSVKGAGPPTMPNTPPAAGSGGSAG
jgi:hypothetical protein